ncbi:MAG: hypothetical protein JSU64_03275 [candidate division WOR-3 bacterium]|nr:MAG: hypothetical protein JSU64_05385 [candidate division WOR-3 bacterium]UCD20172.1 MAG: hypothetical protein JSU64_03275 [candidate division WOR-3 bacterium]
MRSRLRIPKRLALIGGILIAGSGIVNAILGLSIGAIYYDVYPGGNMGHVGILAGVAAIVLGLLIIFVVRPLYYRQQRLLVALGGLLTALLGHAGAVAGALYIGTLGLLLCYVAGFWAIVIAIAGFKQENS